ncbi:AMP-binding protein [Streptomyces sp. PTM05]|uniref:AMP-binding protein n=1 Tax=Streptantibioticus parmotrematis TaxID=2873249 RepID=A0ABS7QSE0_9ACTN|nr:AMP-binding protein [Streptantibioticus parmotrematis]MBY8886107.1 AMP-binding protein [Streptantibioticus parmotrematis]
MKSVTQAFLDTASERSDRVAVLRYASAGRARPLSFRQLEERTRRQAVHLAARGVVPGTRCAIFVRDPVNMLTSLYATVRLGAVPVLIDGRLPRATVARALDAAEPAAFIGDPLTLAARIAYGWGRDSVTTRVCATRLTDGTRPGGARSDFARDAFVPRLDHPALIAFTSGSTGPAKGAIYDHRHLSAHIESLRGELGITPGAVTVSAFLPFALFGPLLGLTTVLPDMDFTRPARSNPHRLAEAVRLSGASVLVASPAVLRTLAAAAVSRGGDGLRTLRALYCFGATPPHDVLTTLHRALPDARIHSVYGATECLPVSVIDSRELVGPAGTATEQGAGTCLGRPLPSVRVTVVAALEQPVPRWSDDWPVESGSIGEITVSGPNVSPDYVGAPDATARAKVSDGSRRVHRTGDLGRIDAEGRLWFCGRVAHRVSTPSGTTPAEPVEAALDRVPGVRRTALVGLGVPGAQVPVLCVEPEPGTRRAARHELTMRLLAAASSLPESVWIGPVLFRKRFPTDVRHNSKIDRAALSTWAERALRLHGRRRRRALPSGGPLPPGPEGGR